MYIYIYIYICVCVVCVCVCVYPAVYPNELFTKMNQNYYLTWVKFYDCNKLYLAPAKWTL